VCHRHLRADAKRKVHNTWQGGPSFGISSQNRDGKWGILYRPGSGHPWSRRKEEQEEEEDEDEDEEEY